MRRLGKELRNWGRWGQDDELGTLNFVTPIDIVNASRLVRKGKVFSLAIPFDENGPQNGSWKRFNPIHTMILSGADAEVGAQDWLQGERYADDMITMPLQCATQWDGLAHIYDDGKMWNGYDAKLVNSFGAQKNGIEKTKDKMVGRGVLLDLPRSMKKEWLGAGEGISSEDLDECIKACGTELHRGDFLLIRTGFMTKFLKEKKWGDYAGGDAPGLVVETARWLRDKQVAAVAMDTWGCEVRPNETPDCSQPWHVITIPNMGLTVGEIWYLDELALDCAKDLVYEFLLVAPALPITGAVGSPVNPIAIK